MRRGGQNIKTTKEIPREIGSGREQARETGNPELAQAQPPQRRKGSSGKREDKHTGAKVKERKEKERDRREPDNVRLVIQQPERQRTIIKRKLEQGSKQRTPEQQTKARQRPNGKEIPKAKRKRR